VALCAAGWARQLVLGHGTLFRHERSAAGGLGCGAMALSILPRLARLGVARADLDALSGGSAARLLAWWVRPPPPKPMPRARSVTAMVIHRRPSNDVILKHPETTTGAV
jgi:hypothetical protein